ncbi:MAG: TrkA C-terminal domain-containing protein [Candidatus Thermoplasmatota archaeon]|nr:TrkA C-terminal domain-containing protein [Candidatus Thermoplasmatota archaeon]
MSEKEAEKMLLELKEKAAFMVDLAYSSVIYDSRDLAEEVYELEEFMDVLNDNFQRLAIRDVKNEELEVNDALAMIQLAICSEMIADSAREIADVELRDVELHPIIKESVLASDEVFVRATVAPSSILKDKKLGDIELASKTGMWIIAIKRKNRWIYDPDKNTILKEGDIVFARGAREGMDHFTALTEGKEKEI